MYKNRLEVLLSAMHLKDFSYINTLNIETNCTIINQCNEEEKLNICDNNRSIQFISTSERGLSRSRNMAIENAKSDMCILCDNDVEYVPGYEKLILKQFEDNPKFDIIIFFVNRNVEGSKPYFHRKKKLSYISVLKTFSPEIAFRRNSLMSKNIIFKEEFGAGSKYCMGEENIFLYECLKKRLKILYVPVKIADLRYEESTWQGISSVQELYNRGAIFYAMTNKFSDLLIIQYILRKRKLYRKEISLIDSYKIMRKGKYDYKKELEGK
jgi:glycosyltransferase involved in cell wall biosynthesis